LHFSFLIYRVRTQMEVSEELLEQLGLGRAGGIRGARLRLFQWLDENLSNAAKAALAQRADQADALQHIDRLVRVVRGQWPEITNPRLIDGAFDLRAPPSCGKIQEAS
jgi:hypothetical protein